MKWSQLAQYMVLIAILAGGVGAFYYVRPNEDLQFAIGTITSIAYIFWGIIHHGLKKDLHARVVIEYILIGTVAVVLLATVTL